MQTTVMLSTISSTQVLLCRATGSRNGPRNGQHWTFWLEDQLTIMGLAVGFSTPALGLEGMVLCSAAALSQQQP